MHICPKEDSRSKGNLIYFRKKRYTQKPKQTRKRVQKPIANTACVSRMIFKSRSHSLGSFRRLFASFDQNSKLDILSFSKLFPIISLCLLVFCLPVGKYAHSYTQTQTQRQTQGIFFLQTHKMMKNKDEKAIGFRYQKILKS